MSSISNVSEIRTRECPIDRAFLVTSNTYRETLIKFQLVSNSYEVLLLFFVQRLDYFYYLFV